jgi:DNA-binding response OmpR family regulator
MPSAPKKILIVEDEASIANVLKLKLEKEGYKILLASNGKKGLVAALKEKPNLILLDIIMPVMDGLTMLEKLRADKVGKKIDVLVLTNLTHFNEDYKNNEYRVSDYLQKSKWKLSDLVLKIGSIIK